MTLEEQALKLYPPLSCYEKEPIEYNRRQAACREAWIRAKREDAAEIERLTAEIKRLTAENERLRAALDIAYPHVVAADAPIRIVEQVRRAAYQQLIPEKG